MLIIEAGAADPSAVVIVERKGWGHPDTLADHLAEKLSRAYACHTLDRVGAVLHHNFDKVALLGGASEVRYGHGRMREPVRVLVNGRAAHRCGGETVPVRDLVQDTVTDFFAERLPELSGHIRVEYNLTENASPGAVITGEEPSDRSVWFRPRTIDDLRERQVLLSNDTSLGTGWAPEHPVEAFVRELADHLSQPTRFAAGNPWLGSDVKVMAHADVDALDVVACVPQKCEFVPDRSSYLDHREHVVVECHRLAAARLPGLVARFRVNVRDLPENDELYMTYTGSSIESGDEGVVGRGNRITGLITPLRPMNVEGVHGKNPVYHVGKLYNVAAQRMAGALSAATGEHAEVHLISATGQRLDRPWRVLVRLGAESVDEDKVIALVRETLDDFPAITAEIMFTDLLLQQ